MKPDTKVLHTKSSNTDWGNINPPVIHASTVAHRNFADFINPDSDKIVYGRYGLEPMDTFKRAISDLYNAYDTIVTSCGLQAVTMAILSNIKCGDHIAIADGVYGPTRNAGDGILQNFGIEVSYFDGQDVNSLKNTIQPNTKIIFFETPNSITMEMPDITGIVTTAKHHNILTIVDDTWGAGYYFNPLDAGIDICLQAATKYIVGHSDALIGTISIKDKSLYETTAATANQFGISVAPDDVYLALRGLKTLPVRIKQHYKNALEICEFLQSHPLVDKVFYPPLPDSPGHQHWKEHFTGGCGLLGFTFKEDYSDNHIGKFADSLKIFKMGFSWGGYESLVTFNRPKRTAKPWTDNRVIRLHIGLEDTADIIAELKSAISQL